MSLANHQSHIEPQGASRGSPRSKAPPVNALAVGLKRLVERSAKPSSRKALAAVCAADSAIPRIDGALERFFDRTLRDVKAVALLPHSKFVAKRCQILP